MRVIDVLGKPCPIPVIEAKKALAEQVVDGITVKVDNIVSVQNLEKMANGYGYSFSYKESTEDSYEVKIIKDRNKMLGSEPEQSISFASHAGVQTSGRAFIIGRNTMGDGSQELGKVLIKGFIYSLTELPVPPQVLIFFNSGAFLTSEGANTLADLKALEEKGTEILTCGTCINYYNLRDEPLVGAVANMYEIAEIISSIDSVITI